MAAGSESCENCGRAIGKLETPRVWRESVVCAECHAKLSAAEAEPAGQQLATAAGQATLRSPPPRVAPPAVVIAHPPAPQVVQHDHYIHQPGPALVQMKGNAWGVVACVFGAVGIAFCWIPLAGLLAIPLGVLAVLIGCVGVIVGLVSRGATLASSIAGLCLGLVAVILPIISTAATAGALATGAASVQRAAEQAERQRTRTNQTPAGAAQPAAEAEWSDGFAGVSQADVTVRVVSAMVSRVRIRDVTEKVSDDAELVIQIELLNKSPTQKLEYRTWRGAPFATRPDAAAIKDDTGNSYSRISYGMGTVPVGGVSRESIYPGKAISDVLVFQPPTEAAKELRLELPAANFGGTGMIRLTIDAAKIRR